MKSPLNGRIVLTSLDVSEKTGYSQDKSREDMKGWKQSQGLSEKDYFTLYHFSVALKVPMEELLRFYSY